MDELIARNKQLRKDLDVEREKLIRGSLDQKMVNELKSLKIKVAIAYLEKEDALRMLHNGKAARR